MVEVEPNNSALSANGPIPPDGFTSTLNVSDDVDFFVLRLQGRRQVSLTFSAISGCTTSLTNPIYAQLTLNDSDGNRIVEGNVAGTQTQTRTWTTPRDATEYVGQIRGLTGCQTLVKMAPVDALITGPLPAPSYPRTLSVTAIARVAQEAKVPVTATGVAADEDRVAVLWTTGGCPAAPDETASGLTPGATLAAGLYNVTLQTTSPDRAGPATLCTWLNDTLGKLQPLLRQQTVQVGPPVDADHDGSPVGADCNDGNASIKPGAREVRGNNVDENCDGRVDPFLCVPATVALGTARSSGGRTKIKSLVVRHVSRSYGVRLRCTGGGCRRAVNRTYSAPRGSKTVSLTSRVRGMRLRSGAKLSLRISRKGYQSRIFTYPMRGGKTPSRSARCANPGKPSTFAC